MHARDAHGTRARRADLATEDDIVAQVTAGLDLSKPAARRRAVHARRRAHALVAAFSTATVEELVFALTAEQDAIGAIVTQRLAELLSPTSTVFDPFIPPHLDLDVMSQVGANGLMGGMLKDAKRAEYRRLRGRWIRQIIWEAAGFHGDELWSGPLSARTLRAGALADLFCRRLRVVERMTYNVNPLPDFDAWKITGGANGTWVDGNWMRLFAYPEVPKKAFESVLDGHPDWRDGGGVFVYEPTNAVAQVRLPDSVATAWHIRVGLPSLVIWVELLGSASVTRTQAVVGMFTVPRPDFRQRAWLFCDEVGCALGLEALWFSWCRRTGFASAFDSSSTPMFQTMPGWGP